MNGSPPPRSLTIQGPPAANAGIPLLDPEGAKYIVGKPPPFAQGVRPGPSTLFGPRGVCQIGRDGPFYIADTGHHRVLGYNDPPTRDYPAADWVLGQPNFKTEARNSGGAANAYSMNMPTAVAAFGDAGLIIADTWNNRVLVWYRRPEDNQVPADLILGQADPRGHEPNRGLTRASASSMHWPSAVLVDGGRLYVADAGNRRVLVWRTLPSTHGEPADFALGQQSLVERSDNAGSGVDRSSMRFPHGLAMVAGNLVVSDAGNNRVLIWHGVPDGHNAPAMWVLGQPDFHSNAHNGSRYWPNAALVNMPYAVAATGNLLTISDTANSRLLGIRVHNQTLCSGMEATFLTGQNTFAHRGDNRWRNPMRDSLCWPYGLAFQGDNALVADTGNNRVLVWPLASLTQRQGASTS